GRPLQGDAFATLVDVKGVAALEARLAGELRLADLVVEGHAVTHEMVAGLDARAEEPPLVAAEDEMRVRDAADLCRRAPVARVGRHRERLRGDDVTESTGRGPVVVVVQRTRVVHRLQPPA